MKFNFIINTKAMNTDPVQDSVIETGSVIKVFKIKLGKFNDNIF